MSSNRLVEFCDVSHSFGENLALSEVSFSVSQHRCHVLLGHNGAGKTTAFRIILGLLAPDRGSVTIAGYNPGSYRQGLAARRRLGAVFETNGLYEQMTAWENIELMARINSVPSTTWEERANHLLGQFNLWHRRDEVVAGWSAGMKRKAAIVRSLIHEPDLLILDEPTAGLDAAARYSLRSHLLDLLRRGKASLLIATQDLMEADRIADDLTILRQGRIVFSGALDRLRACSSLRRFRISESSSIDRVAKSLPGSVIRRQDDRFGTDLLVKMEQSCEQDVFDSVSAEAMELPVSLEDLYVDLASACEAAI